MARPEDSPLRSESKHRRPRQSFLRRSGRVGPTEEKVCKVPTDDRRVGVLYQQGERGKRSSKFWWKRRRARCGAERTLSFVRYEISMGTTLLFKRIIPAFILAAPMEKQPRGEHHNDAKVRNLDVVTTIHWFLMHDWLRSDWALWTAAT